MRLATGLRPDLLGSYSAPRCSSRSQGKGREREETQERKVKGERDKKKGGEEYGKGRGWRGKEERGEECKGVIASTY